MWLALVTFGALLVTRGEAQTTFAGLTQGVCNAKVALRHCSLDLKVTDAVRATWPVGLIPDVSVPLYGQSSECTLFADEIAALIHQLFQDAERKEAHSTADGTSEACYFPLPYCVCSFP